MSSCGLLETFDDYENNYNNTNKTLQHSMFIYSLIEAEY